MRGFSLVAFCALLAPWLWAHEVQPNTLQGAWLAIVYDQNGVKAPDEITAKLKLTIQGDKITIQPRIVAEYKPVLSTEKKVDVVFSVEADQRTEATFKLEPEKGRMDLVWKGPRGDTKTTKGVYVLEDDTLRICFALENKNRPKKFPDAPKTGVVRMVLKREVK